MIAEEAPTTLSEKLKVLEKASKGLEKAFGQGSIMRLGSREIVPVPVIPTGIFSLDNTILGIGGIPRGRITEIYGAEMGGKTTLSLHVIANAQAMGGTAAFIDAEHALDPIYAKALGVDTDNLFISQPDNGENALSIAEALIETNAVDVLVVDSVAALVPQAELDGDFGDAQMGLQARLMSQAMRKLVGKLHKSGCCLIFINQIRAKIGVMFGSPETTTGGRALKFYASLRLDVRRISALKDGEDVTGGRTRIKTAKNKLAAPFREGEFDLVFGKGIDKAKDVIEASIKAGIIAKEGAWYTLPDTTRYHGLDNLSEAAALDTKLTDSLKEQLLNA